MKIPETITVTRTITYNTNELAVWNPEEESSIEDVLSMVLDWAVEDLSHSGVPIHMTDENGAEIPWEDILNG